MKTSLFRAEPSSALRDHILRNVGIAAIVAFVAYAEYVVWIKSPTSQIAAICDSFRTLKESLGGQQARDRLNSIDPAAAAEPVHLIDKAVRACDGEAVDVEEFPAQR